MARYHENHSRLSKKGPQGHQGSCRDLSGLRGRPDRATSQWPHRNHSPSTHRGDRASEGGTQQGWEHRQGGHSRASAPQKP